MHHSNFNGGRFADATLVIHCRTIDNAVWEDVCRGRQNLMVRPNETANVVSPDFPEYLTGVILPYCDMTGKTINLQNFPPDVVA
jgi:hypothetical protein